MKELNEIFIVAWIVFGLYMLVFFAAMADLCSGIRKAKLRGEVRSSYGFKRTVDKLARYYNLLIALTVVDCMQMAGIWYLDIFYGYHIPIFPVVTMIGAIGLGIIEVKSIFEKAE
ncbi:phage holin family protein, partial [Parabacteroides distasonis]|uniref:phage holin family protein n=2 Tax=Tannerellaceae TaxID=2005525 RepID=UPI0022E14BA5